MAFCEYCGNPISETAFYCSNCGRMTDRKMTKLREESKDQYIQYAKTFLEKHKTDRYYQLLVSNNPDEVLSPQGHRLFLVESEAKTAELNYNVAVMGNWKSMEKKKELYIRKQEQLRKVIDDLKQMSLHCSKNK